MCILTIEQVLSILTLAGALIGGLFALYQWQESNKSKRAELIYSIYEKIRFSDSIMATIYMIDYGESWYNDKFHNDNREMELSIDRLLSILNYICYLKKNRNITDQEFSFLNYTLDRVCSSYDMQAYLWNLYHFSKSNTLKCAFHEVIDYAIKNNLFPEDFELNDKTLFSEKKYLAF